MKRENEALELESKKNSKTSRVSLYSTKAHVHNRNRTIILFLYRREIVSPMPYFISSFSQLW